MAQSATAKRKPTSAQPVPEPLELTARRQPAAGSDIVIQTSQPWRLRKHADYQRVYKSSRKQFSASMAYFYAPRVDVRALEHSACLPSDVMPRIGLTVGRVLGKAVERNRIKRRLRAIIRKNLHLLPPVTDVILHPRRTVLELASSRLTLEVETIFLKIASQQKASHAAASAENAR